MAAKSTSNAVTPSAFAPDMLNPGVGFAMYGRTCKRIRYNTMTLENIANATTAATSILALIISTFSFWKQTRQANITLGVTMLREYEKDFFSSPEIRRKRLITSRFLLNREPGQQVPQEAYELLDFFDALGLHVNKGVIDVEMAWIDFYFWFDKYWYLLANDVEELYRYTDGVRYLENCTSLHEMLSKFGVRFKHVPPPEIRYDARKIRLFLEDEVDACDGK